MRATVLRHRAASPAAGSAAFLHERWYDDEEDEDFLDEEEEYERLYGGDGSEGGGGGGGSSTGGGGGGGGGASGADAGLPVIKVVISDGENNEDVVVKIADEGGGIKRSQMPNVFSYMFTTAGDDAAAKEFFASAYQQLDDDADGGSEGSTSGSGTGEPGARGRQGHSFEGSSLSDHGHSLDDGSGGGLVQGEGTDGATDFGRGSPLAGLGYGLPISRAYARFFGGDLQIMSVEGHGTDAYVHLPRLRESNEDETGNALP